ncbi:MAG: methyltransferase domain-containing protein [Lawsonibacter sp.]|nr:methyltransferase domain-containing protein [Lawsonibacter sp.]MCI9656393.1 methyltransferase domain-containing protein [Lawsonibacter sp.]
MSTFWDRVAWLYDLMERSNRAVNAAAAARVAGLVPKGARVLDCAAGTGEFSLAAAERAETVLCTDLSLPMLDRARKKAKKRGLTNISFAQRDITALPDRDGTFEVVIAANVLHLLQKPENAVRELWRVTAPGGRLILPTYLLGQVGTAYGTMIKIFQGVGFHYEHAFTSETYRMLLESLNLAPVLVEVIPGRVPEGIAVLEKSI